MSNEQTAVDWLVKQLQSNIDIRWRGTNIIELGEQAKEIEREQIEQAFEIGADSYYDLRQPSSCIQYYNETYGGNK